MLIQTRARRCLLPLQRPIQSWGTQHLLLDSHVQAHCVLLVRCLGWSVQVDTLLKSTLKRLHSLPAAVQPGERASHLRTLLHTLGALHGFCKVQDCMLRVLAATGSVVAYIAAACVCLESVAAHVFSVDTHVFSRVSTPTTPISRSEAVLAPTTCVCTVQRSPLKRRWHPRGAAPSSLCMMWTASLMPSSSEHHRFFSQQHASCPHCPH